MKAATDSGDTPQHEEAVSLFNDVLEPVMRGPSSSHTDETVDASYAVGRALPSELRCTAAGGLAVTPTFQRLVPLR